MDALFRRYQTILVRFANTSYGRQFLLSEHEQRRYQDNRIIGVLPNAFFVDRGTTVRAVYRTYPLYAKRIGLALSDVALVSESHYADIVRKQGEYRALLHYSGLATRAFSYPQILHDQYFAVSSDGDHTSGVLATWAAAHDATTGTVAATGNVLRMYASFDGANYTIFRTFLYFSVLKNGVVTAASVFGKEPGFLSDAGADIHVCRGRQTDPLQATDFGATDFVSFGHLVPVDNVYNEIVLNSTGIASISTNTRLCLMQSRDQSNTAAVAVVRTQFSSSEETGTGSDPYLQLTLTASTGFPNALRHVSAGDGMGRSESAT